MLRNRILGVIAVIFSLAAAVPAHAWPQISDETIRSAWGAPGGTWNLFPSSIYYADFCVGDAKTADGGCNTTAIGTNNREALLGLVARHITANGGYFCTTHLECKASGGSGAVTINFEPSAGGACFWLCKDGFSGEGCQPINNSEFNLTTGDPACGTDTITRSRFDNTKLNHNNNAYNIEYSVDILHNRYINYGGNYSLEQDVMVGISGWLANGKGAIASPLLFWCQSYRTNELNVFVNLARNTVCLPGYTGPNCEKCKPQNICGGTNMANFVAGTHVMTYSALAGCSTFRCASDDQGFSSASDVTCIDCKGGRVGVNAAGVCITCASGQVFNATSKTCVTAKSISNNDMRYGIGKPATNKVADACWARPDPMDFKCCVFNQTFNRDTGLCQ